MYLSVCLCLSLSICLSVFLSLFWIIFTLFFLFITVPSILTFVRRRFVSLVCLLFISLLFCFCCPFSLPLRHQEENRNRHFTSLQIVSHVSATPLQIATKLAGNGQMNPNSFNSNLIRYHQAQATAVQNQTDDSLPIQYDLANLFKLQFQRKL